jgi:hypothetical protein
MSAICDTRNVRGSGIAAVMRMVVFWLRCGRNRRGATKH